MSVVVCLSVRGNLILAPSLRSREDSGQLVLSTIDVYTLVIKHSVGLILLEIARDLSCE